MPINDFEEFFFYFTRESKTITYSTTKLQNCKLQIPFSLSCIRFNWSINLTMSKVLYLLQTLELYDCDFRLKRWVLTQFVVRFLTYFLLFWVITNLRVLLQTKEKNVLCSKLSNFFCKNDRKIIQPDLSSNLIWLLALWKRFYNYR